MSTRILVAIDNPERSTRILQYVGEMIRGKVNTKVRLFHIMTPIPPELREHGGSEDPVKEEQLSQELRAAQSRWIEEQRKTFAPMLRKLKANLVECGVPSQSISIDSCACVQEARLDQCLLEAAEAWNAGTIVVGWEGFPIFKESVKRHIAENLIRKGQHLTIWVVK